MGWPHISGNATGPVLAICGSSEVQFESSLPSGKIS